MQVKSETMGLNIAPFSIKCLWIILWKKEHKYKCQCLKFWITICLARYMK